MGATARTKWPELGEVYSDTKEFRAAVLTVAWWNDSKMSVERGGCRWTKMRCALFKENGKRCVFGMDVTQRSEARATAREFGRAHFARIGVNPPDEPEWHPTIGMSHAAPSNDSTRNKRGRNEDDAADERPRRSSLSNKPSPVLASKPLFHLQPSSHRPSPPATSAPPLLSTPLSPSKPAAHSSLYRYGNIVPANSPQLDPDLVPLFATSTSVRGVADAQRLAYLAASIGLMSIGDVIVSLRMDPSISEGLLEELQLRGMEEADMSLLTGSLRELRAQVVEHAG
ncbi:hypothetical protein JCM11641_000654 [Rhodosporidiobolus odoratus]